MATILDSTSPDSKADKKMKGDDILGSALQSRIPEEEHSSYSASGQKAR